MRAAIVSPTYLYCGATDVYAETGEQALGAALLRIWTSAALRRTYITGGACAIPNGKSARGDDVHEAFGADYQLPNRTASDTAFPITSPARPNPWPA